MVIRVTVLVISQYTNIKQLCCTSETSIMLCVDYTSIRKEPTPPPKKKSKKKNQFLVPFLPALVFAIEFGVDLGYSLHQPSSVLIVCYFLRSSVHI